MSRKSSKLSGLLAQHGREALAEAYELYNFYVGLGDEQHAAEWHRVHATLLVLLELPYEDPFAGTLH